MIIEYELIITKRVELSEEQKDKREQAERDRGYYGRSTMDVEIPKDYNLAQVLRVVVSENTFNSIRKAALETL